MLASLVSHRPPTLTRNRNPCARRSRRWSERSLERFADRLDASRTPCSDAETPILSWSSTYSSKAPLHTPSPRASLDARASGAWDKPGQRPATAISRRATGNCAAIDGLLAG